MIVDLTMPLSPATPVYPGDPSVEISVAANLEKDGYIDHTIRLGTHNGTHVDAPAHMVKGGKLLKDFEADAFVGPARVVDVRKGYDLSSANIQAGDIVLFYTGHSDNYLDKDYYTKYPVVPEETAKELVKLKVKMVGVDTGSIDDDPFSVHKLLLGNDILIIENLVNLKSLVGKNARVYALPLRLEVEGSPARVIADVQ